MSIFFAYDGSVNGDWIAPYAIRMASRTATRELTVLYAEDVSVPTPELAARFEAMAAHAAQQGVAVSCDVIAARHGVYHGLIERIPEGQDTILVCGLRVKSGRRGFLAGTISEQLLAHRRFHTLAIRVVQPGLLGAPREVLVPAAGDPRGLADGLAVLPLLAPDIARLHVLRVMMMGRGAFRRLSASRAGRLQAEGMAYAHRIEAEVAAATPLTIDQVYPLVRVSDDWAKEVVIQAGHLHADLI